MRLRLIVVVTAAAMSAACGSSAPAAPASGASTSPLTSASAAAAAPLVGRWVRVVTCQELVAELGKAGLGAFAPTAWLGQTSQAGQGSFKPGSPKPTMAHPCTGAIPRLHSHFFTQDGQFGSLDWTGGQVDNGTYKIINGHTVAINNTKFRFQIINGDTLMLHPVLTKAMLQRARAHPQQFSSAVWAVSVAYAGHTWKKVTCQGWC